MTELSRRTILTATAATLAATTASAAETTATTIAYEPAPLPFAEDSVDGLSSRLLTSHYERNYAGAVKRLGAIQTKLAALDPATEPGFVMNGLKREELMALNSAILHEVYFAGLTGATAPTKALGRQIETDFGSLDRWRGEFSAMGRALGGGSGWVLLTWSPRTGRLMNAWAADHTMTVADGSILVALDMYEHAYAIDYGADAGAYIDAFMAALRWDHAGAAFKAAT
ncbi:MAG: superoxide dismutase [Parvularculaceae bacterium]